MKNTTRFVRTLSLLGLAVPFVASPARAQSGNTATGTNALLNNTTGDNNTATGVNAMRTNTSGSNNTATGRGAMYRNIDGAGNTATGLSAMYYNTQGDWNVAMGESALESNTTGYSNTAVGFQAMFLNVVGYANAALGDRALFSSTGEENTAAGYGAMERNTSGDRNTALGYRALFSNTTSNANVAIGGVALENSTGYSNVAVGTGALNTLTTGFLNTAVGHFTSSCATCTNTGTFGHLATASASNTIRIGNTAITQIGGNVGWSNLSDGRYKTNVKANVPGLAFIEKLKPVTFNWQLSKLNEADGADAFASDPVLGEAREAKAKRAFTGFIAQEVEAAANECGFDFSGIVKPANEQSNYQLVYAEFVVPLVKAVQEQQKEIEELREAVRALATDRRQSGDRLGKGADQEDSQHAGMLGSWGGAMTLLSASLALLHFRRRRISPSTT